MKTLCIFESTAQFIPQITAWHLADLGEYLGKQKLYEQQAPQKLKILKEHAIIESAVSSNRIEGVNVNPARVKEVVFGRAHLRDMDEEEVRGYRKALELIHAQSRALKVSEETIRELLVPDDLATVYHLAVSLRLDGIEDELGVFRFAGVDLLAVEQLQGVQHSRGLFCEFRVLSSEFRCICISFPVIGINLFCPVM